MIWPLSPFFFFLFLCICSSSSPLCDPPVDFHIHVTTMCGKGSTYHRHDLFSHGCVCWTGKYWGWWEPDAKFRMTSLCCSRWSPRKEPLTALLSLRPVSLASFCPPRLACVALNPLSHKDSHFVSLWVFSSCLMKVRHIHPSLHLCHFLSFLYPFLLLQSPKLHFWCES